MATATGRDGQRTRARTAAILATLLGTAYFAASGTTQLVATRVLDPSCADALLTADDDDAFAAQIVRLFGDAALRRRLAYAGRAFVERHHSWEQACAALEDVYRDRA